MWVGLQALVASVLVNLALRGVALAALDIPDEFLPLKTPGPTIVLTSAGVLAAVGVFATIRRYSARPILLFRLVAAGTLLVSFVPDVWMLTAAGAAAFPGATLAGVTTLMLQHVAAYATVVWMLTARRP